MVSNMTLDPGDTLVFVDHGDSPINLIQPNEIRAIANTENVVSFVGFGERTVS